jgi:rhomboid protease GluP
MVVFGASGSVPVFLLGRWWTLLSAAWLHGGVLHILFNLMWIRQLAPVTADIYGASRLVIIYTSASIGGFLLSTLGGHQLTLGASAPLFGLFGALVWAGRRTGSSEIGRMALMYAVIFLIFGFIWPNVDNLAHVGGFVGGFSAAYILNPIKKETFGNLVTALVCVALMALSVLVSIVTAWYISF